MNKALQVVYWAVMVGMALAPTAFTAYMLRDYWQVALECAAWLILGGLFIGMPLWLMFELGRNKGREDVQ